MHPRDRRRDEARALPDKPRNLFSRIAYGRRKFVDGGAYLAKPDSAKSESAVQERAKPYLAKPGN